jgi:FMN phosphatase YigB (HAD superfamily)
MKSLIFDLDDTLLMSGTYKRYSDIVPNSRLTSILYNLQNNKYLYTNGTYGHGINGLDGLNLRNIYDFHDDKIYGRDSIPYMKPDFKSFNHVNNNIMYDHHDYNKKIFFDDLQENLKTAHNIGWETVWIHEEADNNMKPDYIDYAYTNVVQALENIDLN